MTMQSEQRNRIGAHRRKEREAKATAAIPTPSGSGMTDAILERIDEMERTPKSGVAMCHKQGKTAVYVSKDRKYLIEHPPHGPSSARFALPYHKAGNHSSDGARTRHRHWSKRGRQSSSGQSTTTSILSG